MATQHEISDFDYIMSALGNAIFSGVPIEIIWECAQNSVSRETFDRNVSAAISAKEGLDGMLNLDTFLKQPRTKAVFHDIANGVTRRMPCGDARVATRLKEFGAIRLKAGRLDREITTSWELTELGATKHVN